MAKNFHNYNLLLLLFFRWVFRPQNILPFPRHTSQSTDQGTYNDSGLAGVESSLDRDDKLGDNGQDFAATVLQHIKSALYGKETIRLLLLTQAVKKDGQVVVVVELFNVDLPLDPVAQGVGTRQKKREEGGWRAVSIFFVIM